MLDVHFNEKPLIGSIRNKTGSPRSKRFKRGTQIQTNQNRNRKQGFVVNIYDTNISCIQVNSKQWNNALITCLHLKVTVRPSRRN